MPIMKHMRPLVGITTSELHVGDLATLRRAHGTELPSLHLGMTYVEAVERAGAIPVVLPPLDPALAAGAAARLDALVVTGGPDLHPSTYGAEPDPRLGPTEPRADAWELELLRAADAAALPVLGVCRGMQALNVARGGTLHQHLEGLRQTEPGDVTTSTVRFVPGSRLARLARLAGAPRAEAEVNSFHHQALAVLGHGLRVTGRDARGVVKAVEGPGERFVMGVQWHAEALSGGVHAALFEALVGAAVSAPLSLAA